MVLLQSVVIISRYIMINELLIQMVVYYGHMSVSLYCIILFTDLYFSILRSEHVMIIAVDINHVPLFQHLGLQSIIFV